MTEVRKKGKRPHTVFDSQLKDMPVLVGDRGHAMTCMASLRDWGDGTTTGLVSHGPLIVDDIRARGILKCK